MKSHYQNKTDPKKRKEPLSCTKKLLDIHIKWFSSLLKYLFPSVGAEKHLSYTIWKQVWTAYSRVLVTVLMENIRVCVHFSRFSFLTVNWDLRISPPPSSEERGCWEEQKISSPYPAQKPHGQPTWAHTLSCHTTNCCPSSFLKRKHALDHITFSCHNQS